MEQTVGRCPGTQLSREPDLNLNEPGLKGKQQVGLPQILWESG